MRHATSGTPPAPVIPAAPPVPPAPPSPTPARGACQRLPVFPPLRRRPSSSPRAGSTLYRWRHSSRRGLLRPRRRSRPPPTPPPGRRSPLCPGAQPPAAVARRNRACARSRHTPGARARGAKPTSRAERLRSMQVMPTMFLGRAKRVKAASRSGQSDPQGGRARPPDGLDRDCDRPSGLQLEERQVVDPEVRGELGAGGVVDEELDRQGVLLR